MQPDYGSKSLLVQYQPLILGSASPRRRDLLQNIGLEFSVVPAAVPEDAEAGEMPADFVCRLAEDKAQAVAGQREDVWVLAADTIVVRNDGLVLGKPDSTHDARGMLASLAGQKHEVMTAYALINRRKEVFLTRLDRTWVLMLPLSADVIAAYVATGEPMDKAGAYALQGIGGAFVAAVEGAYSTVIGLPLHLVLTDLLALGIVGVKASE